MGMENVNNAPLPPTEEGENEKTINLEGGKEIKIKKVAEGKYEIVSENITDNYDEDLGVTIDREGKEASVGFEDLDHDEDLREYCGATTHVRVGDAEIYFHYKHSVEDGLSSSLCTIKAPSLEAAADALKKLPLKKFNHEDV